METINKLHKEITSNQRLDLAAYFKISNDRTIYFSAKAADDFGLFPGLYMHFMNDEDRWYFYCNNEEDGFKIIERLEKNSVIICSKSLVHLIIKRMNISIGTRFPIELTANKLKADHMMEINFRKPF